MSVLLLKRTFLLIIVFLSISKTSYCQKRMDECVLTILDAVTNQKLDSLNPVNVSWKISFYNISDIIFGNNGSAYARQNGFYIQNYPDKVNVCRYSEVTNTGSIRIAYHATRCFIESGFETITNHLTWKVDIEISASGYETVYLTDQAEGGYYGPITPYSERAPMYSTVKLIRKKDFVDLSGNLNVNQTVSGNNVQNSSLDVLSTKQIADQLGVPESTIIDLIVKQKLKGKKIGDKYFVRKEDFNAYMKQ